MYRTIPVTYVLFLCRVGSMVDMWNGLSGNRPHSWHVTKDTGREKQSVIHTTCRLVNQSTQTPCQLSFKYHFSLCRSIHGVVVFFWDKINYLRFKEITKVHSEYLLFLNKETCNISPYLRNGKFWFNHSGTSTNYT